jgi:NAD(P)-dependent dehydrogenase (short-subunit alcohol dehydrogenase family)
VGRLEGKAAIVTGGAKGIGRAIVERFLEEGAQVAAVDVDAATLPPEGSLGLVADVSDEPAVERAVAAAAGEFGALHVLVNNAAVFIQKGIEATVEEWQRVLAVNVMGAGLMAKHAVPHIRRAGGGAIVNIGSVSSFIAQPGFLTYNASKAAIAEMTRCMALDLADDGIRVNGVCPGAVWSSTVQDMAAELGLSREEAAKRPNLGAEHMIKRLGDPREIANAVLFLASDEASFITGENLMVDAGWTAA